MYKTDFTPRSKAPSRTPYVFSKNLVQSWRKNIPFQQQAIIFCVIVCHTNWQKFFSE